MSDPIGYDGGTVRERSAFPSNSEAWSPPMNDRMTAEERAARLAEIRKREEKASPEPWSLYPARAKRTDGYYYKPAGILDSSGQLLVEPQDFELAAHARADIPWLLAEIDRLTAERDAARFAIEQEIAVLQKYGDGRTHWEGCERTHASCAALLRLMAALAATGPGGG